MTDPQLRHRDMVIELRGSAERRVSVTGNPIKFADSLRRLTTIPPVWGGTGAAKGDTDRLNPRKRALLMNGA